MQKKEDKMMDSKLEEALTKFQKKMSHPTIIQEAFFERGPFDGTHGNVVFQKPFYRGMKTTINGELYVVKDGPIEECIEQTQHDFDGGVVTLLHFDSIQE